MNGQMNFEEYLDVALEAASADQTEVLVYKESSALTRFSNSEIHQNMAEKNTAISIRSIFGRKIGTSSTNKLETESIKKAVAEAEKNARLSPEDTAFVSLPKSGPVTDSSGYNPETAASTPAGRAEMVSDIIKMAADNRLTAAGSISANEAGIAVANSLGSRSIGDLTDVYLNLVVMGENSSGFADYYGRDINAVNPAALARRAIDKAIASNDPKPMKPGKYAVILEPAAVADMLGFLAYSGLGALAVQEKRSFMTGNFGKKLVSGKITVWDDANDRRTVGLPFDFEAVPKQKVVFFDKGVATQVVYDSYTAAKEGKRSTGHALPAPNTFGPVPTNIFMATGDTDPDKMIASTEKGILVTRFHYTNLEDPMRAVFTGMTRDGTFMIEDGRVTSGIKNMRFTQSILEALQNVTAVSQEGHLTQSFIGACFAPSLKISEFNFTGATEF